MSESADNYGRVVARLNPRWRVIECRHQIQWILQYRASAETYPTSDWKGRSYCRTSEALRRCAQEHTGLIDPSAAAVLAALPVRIEARQAAPAVENATPPRPFETRESVAASEARDGG